VWTGPPRPGQRDGNQVPILSSHQALILDPQAGGMQQGVDLF
jgi:hypothetical protein